MKKIFPLLFIFGVVVIFFRQFFLQGLLPIPADDIVGLYNPFRDFYASDYPRGIPFKNFLITDPVRQQFPWRYESFLQEKDMQLPLWSPYNFSGTPLLGNQQSAALYPLNVLFFVFPFAFSWSLLVLLQPLLAGVFMFWYLRNLKLSSISSLLGSISFAFCGFMMVWLEWNTLDHAALWLPLSLLSIDKIFSGKRKILWFSIFFASLIFSFLAGHIQTFIYVYVLSHSYLFAKWLFSKEKLKTILFGMPFGFAALIVASIQWFPLVQFILHSARDVDFVMSPGWFFPVNHLITFLVPDFFGNPATLNYWSIWNYAEFAGYIGIPSFIFALFAVFWVRRKIIWFFAGIAFLSLLFIVPTPISNLPLQLRIPFLSTTQPTRLLVLIDFSLAVLAAFGFENFLRKNMVKMLSVLGVFLVIFGALWLAIMRYPLLHISLQDAFVAKQNLYFPSSIFLISTSLVVLCFIFRKRTKTIFVLSCLLLVILGFDLVRFGEKFTPFTKPSYLFPSTTTLTYLQKNLGNYRIMATDPQILPPNFSVMYHLESLDGYDPLYIKEYGELIAAMERSKPDIHSPFGFNRIITPHNYASSLADLLGVKYVLSLQDISSVTLKKVFQEGQTRIYENSNVYPRAFFVTKIKQATSNNKSIYDMFTTNLRDTAIVEGDVLQTTFSPGQVQIDFYTPNTIQLTTKTSGVGFLVLTDVYYPTWNAYIDGKETNIYRTDYALRGIRIPSGTHKVTFSVQLW